MEQHKIIPFEEIHKNGRQLKVTLNSSKDDVKRLFSQIETEMQKEYVNFFVLKKICYEIINRFPLYTNNYNDRFILRSRPNYNGEVFKSTKDISYNPHLDLIKPGRFNLYCDPVFYGSDPASDESFDATLTGMNESCKELFDYDKNILEQYFTVGKWNVIRPLKVLVLSHYDRAESKCPFIKDLNGFFLSMLKNSYSEEDLQKCYSIYGFFSEKAGVKNDAFNGYILTTALFNALKEFYGEEVGVMYSSSMTDNQGLNVALSRELIDRDYLKLEQAIMFKCNRNPDNGKKFNIFPCSNPAFPDADGNLKFTGII